MSKFLYLSNKDYMQVPLYASNHQVEYNRKCGVIFIDYWFNGHKRFHIVNDALFCIFLLEYGEQLKHSKII